MAIGENIRSLRQRYNLSQEELGEIAGVSGKAVSTWENNSKTPRIPALQKIADRFGLSVSDLFGESIPDDIDFALLSEAKELTAEQKKSVIDYARFLKNGGK